MFFFNSRHSILSLFFFCRVDSLEQPKVRLSIYFSIGGHTTTALCSSTMRYQVLFSAPIIPHHLLHSRFNTHTSLHSNLYTNAAPGNVVWSQMYHQMRLHIDIWDICSNLCYICICRMQQLNKMPGRNVLYGVTQKKIASTQLVSFPSVPIFFRHCQIFSSERGKNPLCPWEKRYIPWENFSEKRYILGGKMYWGNCSVAGSGPGSLSKGNPRFFLQIFLGGTGFFHGITGFFPTEFFGEFKGQNWPWPVGDSIATVAPQPAWRIRPQGGSRRHATRIDTFQYICENLAYAQANPGT